MTHVIRKAKKSDITVLSHLMEEMSGKPISQEDMYNRLKMVEESSTDTIFVYEKNSEIQATLVFRIRENIREVSRYGEICIIVVRSSAKRHGIGRQLMDFAEHLAKELGCKGTYFISGFGRKAEAHQFYQDLGYKITGYRFVKEL
ncbi:GNAT family N-acetyltransferase [Paenibacillus albiflavus]|uniref:GNAT family N-acetyltransferase n=1 Tax=Paenibacillus albiflavus TaxID=2545760 RepID=A0A4R4E5K6_9BACL|nr:GNAT family N-acetyltransferase [Paenibacillus albiflavus]TCZ74030.1 GNAT family N-acetyltransferase [Paenibacillus albiflavus]